MSKEHERLRQAQEHTAHWRRWGPYLSERQWGTVREDYSADGDAWAYFPHDHARSRAYRWGEDGLLGFSDNHQRLCFAVALWNGKDPILKERLFGLANCEGNHGEDVKECYYYLDNTPTHSYMKALYKYPQASYPYLRLVEENRRCGKDLPEFELIQTGVFDEDRYFDVFIEYAKADADDILIRVTAVNAGPDDAVLHVLPTLWFRNTWDWNPGNPKPLLRLDHSDGNFSMIGAEHPSLGKMWLATTGAIGALFTENETNRQRLFGSENASPYVKDGIDSCVVHGNLSAVNPGMTGTKAAFHHTQDLASGASCVIRLRLSNQRMGPDSLTEEFDAAFALRIREADEFYSALAPEGMGQEARSIERQAFAGMLWNKQFYHYVVKDWLEGDPTGPPVAPERKRGRNHAWEHLYIDDVLSMPDKWEYPWFAAWDLAFHCIPLAMIDPDFRQAAASAADEGVVHASEWPAAGLRVGI